MDIIIFIVALSILVLVHEMGHFIAAKLTGVKVEEFGLGLPPQIGGKKIGETVFSLNWLPIGGFCRLYGEDPTLVEGIEGKKMFKRTFAAKNPAQKLLIVLGGVLMNVVLAVVIFTAVYAVLGIPQETKEVQIIEVVKNTPADMAGLKVDDVVQMVNGIKVESPAQLTSEVGKYKGTNVKLQISNDQLKDVREVTVEVRANPPAGEGSMGVAISNTKMVKLPWYQWYKGIGAGFKEAYYWGKIIFDGLVTMVKGIGQGKIPKDVSGPIGMYEATSSIRQTEGIWAVVHFFAIVSVNLAVVNVLPFPALDGGRIIFVAYEFIFRKRANATVEAVVNNAGMMVLLALIGLITLGDVIRLIKR